MEKINPAKIIKDHIRTLKSYNSDRYSSWDSIIFLIFPIGLAGVLAYYFPKSEKNPDEIFDKTTVDILVTSLSIFAGLLFNLLIMIYGIVKKVPKGEPYAELKATFLKEIYTNISYSIFISMLAVVILIISLLGSSYRIIQIAIACSVYFLITNFILTLLMILRRVHILLSQEFAKNN